MKFCNKPYFCRYYNPLRQNQQLIKAWSENWPWYKQGCFGNWDDRCDTVVGPCSCGAWHVDGEFELINETLYRYGKEVCSMNQLLESKDMLKCATCKHGKELRCTSG